MGERGPAKKPRLTILKEGNPGRRPVPEALELPPAEIKEPDWSEWFPVVKGPRAGDNELCRTAASAEWRRVVPTLEAAGLLADVDLAALTEYCTCVARVLQCERDISLQGLTVRGSGDNDVANPNIRASIAYRAQARNLGRRFGLTPSDRNGLGKPVGGGDGKPGPLDF